MRKVIKEGQLKNLVRSIIQESIGTTYHPNKKYCDVWYGDTPEEDEIIEWDDWSLEGISPEERERRQKENDEYEAWQEFDRNKMYENKKRYFVNQITESVIRKLRRR